MIAAIKPELAQGDLARTPAGYRVYVLGVDPKDSHRLLVEYEAKDMGTDSYPSGMLTLIHANPAVDEFKPLADPQPRSPRRRRGSIQAETAIAPATLDTEISALYQQATEAEATAEAAGLAAAQLYWSLGEKLTQKKAELGHGAWLPFLEGIGIHERKAQRAMQLNSAYPKCDTLSHLTLTQALTEIKQPQIAAPPVAIQRDLSEAMTSLREGLAAKQQPPDLLALRKSDENYTLPELIESVRRVLGQIDLDPASCAEANATVKAAKFYDRQSNGITHDWHGYIWLNAPYSYPLIELFSKKLIEQWQIGNVLGALSITNNGTETAWFQSLASACTARLDFRGRREFYNPYKNYGDTGNRQGQCLFYFGQDAERFYSEFEGAGQFYPPPPVVAPAALSASPKPVLIGALAELHYAVRKIAGVNECDWDEAMVDELANELLKTLEVKL